MIIGEQFQQGKLQTNNQSIGRVLK